MQIDYQQLWNIGDALKTNSLTVIDKSTQKKEEIEKLIRGEWEPNEPIVYQHYLGKNLTDLIGTAYPGRYLLSNRVVEILRSGKFSGWKTYPVKILKKTGQEILGYQGLSITGRSGPPNDSRRQKIHEFPSGQFIRVRGLFFDEATWDRSDVFLIENTRYICVTNETYKAISSINPSNIKFTRLDKVSGIITKKQYETNLGGDDGSHLL